jgi:hypothetical protein
MTAIDITRFLDKPRKHYSGARLQQGRVLLDSDFNETSGLHESDETRALVDLIGSQGSPDQGFEIDNPATGAPFRPNLEELPATPVELGGVETFVRVVSVHDGRFYLGGRRLDLESAESFPFQRGFLQLGPGDLPIILEQQPDAVDSPVVSGDLIDPFRDLYYLHAWDQTVSVVEDEEFQEAALGGRDTSARVRRMNRVEVLGNLDDRTNIVAAAWEAKIRLLEQDNARFDRPSGELLSNGRLNLTFRTQVAATEDCGECTSDPPQRFLGVANETARIMLTSPTTYVWALDNAAPLYRVKVTGLTAPDGSEVRVTMMTPPSDEVHWPLAGRVVEILPFAALLDGAKLPGPVHPHFRKVAAEVGVFTRVADPFDPGTVSFTIDTQVGLQGIRDLISQWDPAHPDADTLNVDPGDGSDARFFYMRLWHDAPRPSDVELPVSTSPFGPTLAGTDVVPVFQSLGRRGDFWVIALRPGTPERVVPFDLATNPGGVPPHGPRHFYAPLALVQGGKQASAPNDPPKVTSYKDARAQIRPLTDQGCVTLTVGDGVASTGQFSAIQDAIDALPEDGGRIAVRPGTYRERIHIVGHNDVIIEGCGEATVIETPDQSPVPIELDNETETTPPPALVVIDDASHVTFTGFRLNVIEEIGIFLQSANSVVLRALNVVAGVRLGPRFARGNGPSEAPLIRVKDSDTVELGALTVEPASRPTLDVTDTDHVRVEQVTAVGVTTTTFSPGQAMLRFQASSAISIRDTILSPFGQIGVFLAHESGNPNEVQTPVAEVTDVEMSGLSIVCGSHRSLSTGTVTPSQPGVSIDRGLRVTLEGSSIIMDDSFSEHAAVVAGGTDLVIRGNRIEALSRCFDVPTPLSPSPSPGTCRDLRVLAWAGLQIRGNSTGVAVRENHIIGGVGHGITLGSVIWAADVFRFEGAGRGQISVRADGARAATGLISRSFRDERGVFFFAQDEGALTDVVISDNRIEQMFGNGVSALSVLGLPDGALIETRNLRVERNTIIGNLLRPAENVLTRSDFLPFPTSLRGSGIFLPVLPFGGIVLAAAIHADIRGNVIVGNGSSPVLPTNGIFVLNGDAIVISENRIAGNGARANPVDPLRPGVRAGIAVMLAGTADVHTQAKISALLAAPEKVRSPVGDAANEQASSDIVGFHVDGSALAVIGNNVVHPEGRALHAVATGPVRIEGNHLASLGNHGADVPAEQFAIGDVVFVQNLGAPWEKIDYTAIINSSIHSPNKINDYLLSSPWFFVGEGGAILFTNNQVIYDWLVERLPSRASRAPVSFFPVALLSTDHVSMDGNQLGFRLRNVNSPSEITSPVTPFLEPVLGHVLTLGGTVQVSGNRISEKVQTVTLSLVSFSQLMNLTSFNQMTHEMFALNYRKRMQFEIDRTNALIEGTPRHVDEPGHMNPPAESFDFVFDNNINEVTSDLTNHYARRGNQVMFRANQFEVADNVADEFNAKSNTLPKYFFLTRAVGLFFELMRERQ